MDRRDFPGVQWRSSSTLLQQKTTSLDTLGRLRETVWLFLHHTSPKVAHLRTKRDFLSLWFPPPGTWDQVSEHPASPAVQEAAPPKILNGHLHEAGMGKCWESGRLDSWYPQGKTYCRFTKDKEKNITTEKHTATEIINSQRTDERGKGARELQNSREAIRWHRKSNQCK